MLKHFKIVFLSRNASLLLLASITSTFGDWAYFVALSAHLAKSGGMEVLATIATFRFGCIFALGPFAGAIVERLPKKATMIASDLARFVLMGALALVMAFWSDQAWLMAIIAIASSIVGTLFTPARRALLPHTVAEESRLALNAIDGSIGTLTLTVAPAVAGLMLIWMQSAGVVLANGCSFVLSALLLLLLDKTPDEAVSEAASAGVSEAAAAGAKAERSLLREMREGVRHIVRVPEVLAITFLAFTSHIAVGATWVFVPLVSLRLGLGESGTGYLSSAIGLGSMAGMLIGGTIRKGREMGMAFFAVLAFAGSVGLWSALHSYFVGAFLGAGLMGLTANLFEAPCWSVLQSKTEKSLYARVFSGFDAIALVGMTLGTQAAALFSEAWPLRSAILAVAALMLFVYAVNFVIYRARPMLAALGAIK